MDRALPFLSWLQTFFVALLPLWCMAYKKIFCLAIINNSIGALMFRVESDAFAIYLREY